uniref:Putative toxin-antitoxin system toxin component, PIN family n=1 Tax=Candidatus Kentrum sp. FW TaxID=2126338 RepID=A0A450U073_9GAMM|nr:MAG: putative toxin-antitoxin system toxin component, PIN family [Candidatus Kentron sp. FW]
MRVVFDTNTVVSALLFGGSLNWLVAHWQDELVVTPLVSRETAGELLRVLGYPKFGLSREEIDALASRYLPFAERIEITGNDPGLLQCRDVHDRKFIGLAISGDADVLVSGDSDLQALRGQLPFTVETPKEYRARFFS